MRTKIKDSRTSDTDSIKIGSVTFGPAVPVTPSPAPVLWPVDNVSYQSVGTPFFFDDVRKQVGGFTALRRIRDEKLFLQTGCHSFREWCMKYFGERLGGWIDDTL
jgi:hypothetical protein